MSNPLELPFGTPLGKAQDPLQSLWSEQETIINLRSTILATPSYLGGSNHQEKQVNPVAKHKYQVPLDAITQAMHLDSLPISQRWWINDRDEWEDFG